jgi:hypothetical protein
LFNPAVLADEAGKRRGAEAVSDAIVDPFRMMSSPGTDLLMFNGVSKNRDAASQSSRSFSVLRVSRITARVEVAAVARTPCPLSEAACPNKVKEDDDEEEEDDDENWGSPKFSSVVARASTTREDKCHVPPPPSASPAAVNAPAAMMAVKDLPILSVLSFLELTEDRRNASSSSVARSSSLRRPEIAFPSTHSAAACTDDVYIA